VADEVPAFGRREEVQRGADQRADVIEGAWARRAEERLEFGEGEFDGVEVGTVGREKAEVGAGGLESGADLGVFVDREIVEDDDIAGP
jgi:hypothetical protein